MEPFNLDVSGNLYHHTKGTKSVVGVASDNLTVYYDTADMEQAMETIARSVRLHALLKDMKNGLIPVPQVRP